MLSRRKSKMALDRPIGKSILKHETTWEWFISFLLIEMMHYTSPRVESILGYNSGIMK